MAGNLPGIKDTPGSPEKGDGGSGFTLGGKANEEAADDDKKGKKAGGSGCC